MLDLYLITFVVGVSTGLKGEELQNDVLKDLPHWSQDTGYVDRLPNPAQPFIDVHGKSNVCIYSHYVPVRPTLPLWDKNRSGRPLTYWEDQQCHNNPYYQDSLLPSCGNKNQLPLWDKSRPGVSLPSWNLQQQQPLWDFSQVLPTLDDHHQKVSRNNNQLGTFLYPWDRHPPLPALNVNQARPLSPGLHDNHRLIAWDVNKPLPPWDNHLHPTLQPPWDDMEESLLLDKDVTAQGRLLEIYLLVWDQVERRLRELLSSAENNSKQGIRDQSTRSVGVMLAVLKVAQKLAKNCSPIDYVRIYRQTVTSQLLRAQRSPEAAIKHVSKILDTIGTNTKQVRALVFEEKCRQCGCNQPSENPTKLEREKKLAVALGILGFSAFTAYPLKQAIRDNHVIDYMLKDQKAQGKMYSLMVKTARILQMVSNKQPCELQDIVPWLNDKDDNDSIDNYSSFEVMLLP